MTSANSDTWFIRVVSVGTTATGSLRGARINPSARTIRSIYLGLIFLLSSCLCSVSLAQVTLGGTYWDAQASDHDGGPASTQLQAAYNWLGTGLLRLGGACGPLGTPQYIFCPLANGQGNITDALHCPYPLPLGGSSPDGLTCPGEYFLSLDAVATADCGCDANNNNKSGDPISPANGNVSLQEMDVPAPLSVPADAFQRFYNSASPAVTDLVTGWSHSFSRRIIANVQTTPFQPYFASYPRDSSLYSTPASACTSGWGQIRSLSSQWSNTTSSYANGVCSLS